MAKFNIARALQDAVRSGGLPCKVLADGATVVIDNRTAYGPDAVVQCGATIDLDALTIAEPMIVVEVISPSSAKNDAAVKTPDYFSLPSVAHVLVVDPVKKLITKHSRGTGQLLSTEFLRVGQTVQLDPPGIEFPVADCFADL